MAKINSVNPAAVNTIKETVNRMLKSGEKVTRECLLLGLGYSKDEITNELKSVVSALVSTGEVAGYKLIQREGIVPADHKSCKEKNAEAVAANKQDRQAKKDQKEADKVAKKTERLQNKAAKEAQKLADKAAKDAEKASKVAATTATTDATVSAE